MVDSRIIIATHALSRLPVCALVVGLFATAASGAGDRLAVRTETGVRTAMRDGVALVADVYRPETEGKYPLLLQRTPYNRKGAAAEAEAMAARGYIVVIQDTRGRFDSEGEFYPFLNESEDGYDTVEWAANLPGSNRQVGMFGGSYVGATQMLAAIAKPPHLKAIFPYVTAAEYYDGWTYESGALMQWFASSWTSGLAQDTARRKLVSRPRDWVWEMPVDEYRVAGLPQPADLAPYFRDWVRHETDDSYWKRWKISDHYPELTVKGLHGAGWHDIFMKGSIKNFTGLRESSNTAEARQGQRLMVGPWAHASTSPEGKIGDVVFGKQAVLDMTGTALAWFDYALKGVANEYASGKPVVLFVMGANAWREEDEFPPRRARPTKFYLSAAKGANTVAGDGALSLNRPEPQQPDVFEYDPGNPTPTIGGRLCCANDALPPGPFDQRPNEARRDVLVYSTPPLEKDLEATGYVRMELYAATTAPDTDFTAMLVDVDPSGYARFLTDGVVRARYRNSTTKAEPLAANRTYRYDIDLWATSNLFRAGHRIRLYVSSSNFPRFSRNPNTGKPTFGARGFVKATQTVFHDPKNPSALILPVVSQ
ncbi:MAG: CocE/NonD family hydrolase [Bryobacteraceae bacterium]|nr:CocE/NonD family hydrolase [Bryobacteraceae bacterium]